MSAMPMVQRSKLPKPNALPALNALPTEKKPDMSRNQEIGDLLNELNDENKSKEVVKKQAALPPLMANLNAPEVVNS